MYRLVMGVVSAIGIAACADQAPHVSAVAPCTGHVAPQVGTGRTPTITWQPACAVALVTVTDAADSLGEVFLWIAASYTFSQTIVPPVVYGQMPDGAGPNILPADSLIFGHRYMVRLSRTMLIGTPAMDSMVFTARASTP